MIFLTVGTLFPFDRLVRAVDLALTNVLIEDEIFAQIGYDSFKPENMQYTEVLDEDAFNEKVDRATFLISHAGMGSILVAMNHNKPLLVMPRRKHLKEHVNDHQVATARKFEELGHILAVYDIKDLPNGIRKVKNFIPRKRKVSPHAVVNRIRRFLNSLSESQ